MCEQVKFSGVPRMRVTDLVAFKRPPVHGFLPLGETLPRSVPADIYLYSVPGLERGD